MTKDTNIRIRALRDETPRVYRNTVVSEKPQFDKAVDHLPRSVVEKQVERLLKENKQALDALSKL